MNLIILSLLLFLIFRKGSMDRTGHFYWIAGLTATSIMLLSFVRVYLFPFFAGQTESGNYLTGILLSFLLANPYPLLPYLAYGIFGVMIGLMIHQGRITFSEELWFLWGCSSWSRGLAGMMNFDKTISKPDFFWYFKTNFELGLFIMMVVLCRFVPAPGSRILSGLAVIQWFSRVSLTIYLLETTVSEVLQYSCDSGSFPGWNETINGCLAFGAINILLMGIVIVLLAEGKFKYSLEYFWVILFERLGKKSTKLRNRLMIIRSGLCSCLSKIKPEEVTERLSYILTNYRKASALLALALYNSDAFFFKTSGD